ncbi:MAG TPA: MraY family glycosyltransferase [Candidatus Baltobacteraceae bacterium]|nr:MraY family glycosyltransferase [Candidatus Baltobacteraceae bacterium]
MVLYAFIAGFLLALAATPLAARFARKIGAVDVPDGGRKTHARPTPLMGGLAIFVAFVAAALLIRGSLLGGFLLPKHLAGIAFGGLILMIGGALDDRYRLRPLMQLAFPAAAALVVIASGIGADLITNPLGGTFRLDLWEIPLFTYAGNPYHLTLPADLFTFVWLMGMMYTTKLLDGLDGLVTGLGVIGFFVIAMLSLTPDVAQPELARLAMAAAGAAGGFLFYNMRPASVFLGEGGSTFIGFLLGVMAILSGGKIGVTLLVLAVPIMDVVWTIARRIQLGRSIAEGGVDHLHFRLVRWGLSPGAAVLLFWLFAAAFGGAGLFIRGREKLLALGILAILFIVITLWLRRRPHGPDARQTRG